jgi:hypothetical protein
MKRILSWTTMGILAAALTLPAQNAGNRAPKAYGDKDKDGICDITGKPVGQRQGQGQRKGMRQGKGKRQGKGMPGRQGRMGRQCPRR